MHPPQKDNTQWMSVTVNFNASQAEVAGIFFDIYQAAEQLTMCPKPVLAVSGEGLLSPSTTQATD